MPLDPFPISGAALVATIAHALRISAEWEKELRATLELSLKVRGNNERYYTEPDKRVVQAVQLVYDYAYDLRRDMAVLYLIAVKEGCISPNETLRAAVLVAECDIPLGLQGVRDQMDWLNSRSSPLGARGELDRRLHAHNATVLQLAEAVSAVNRYVEAVDGLHRHFVHAAMRLAAVQHPAM
ncbi:hypothetical protein ACGF0J_14235 [Nonomuraea sp. NPDC047897]|uniref:hypothetical protein n=1 Tax=Nonomuraea sp. NPDC047897 TaxID=3364346 RepID=UPI003710B2B0